MVYQILIGLTIILWSGLWSYSTLLVVLVFMKDSESLYAYPMQVALDRFVDNLGFSWLKPLHKLEQTRLRQISYGMFGAVTLGLSLLVMVLS